LFKQEDEYYVQREGRRVGGGWEEILNRTRNRNRKEKEHEHKFR
jgi:hypothetical protein